MSLNNRRILLTLIGAIFFDFLFWEEYPGFNLLFFAIFITSVQFLVVKPFEVSKPYIILLSGSIVTAFATVFHGSFFSIFTFVISFIALQFFIFFQKKRSIISAWYYALFSFVLTPVTLISMVKVPENFHANFKKVVRFLVIAIVPVLISTIFYLIYRSANSVFMELTDRFFENLAAQILSIIPNFSPSRFMFFIYGLLISTFFIYKSRLNMHLHIESKRKDVIVRKRNVRNENNTNFSNYDRGMIRLKKEYQSAILLLLLVNSLTFIINTIDIFWVWFDLETKTAVQLSLYVHEGTWLLIVSIFIAMIIVLFFFRKNLNFYPKNSFLKILAYAWLAQNIILAISVGIRNFHYIFYYGLTYKRIGVLIFLLCVVSGLFTMLRKIYAKRSLYYLLNKNSWTFYIIITICSIIDWSTVITINNIENRRPENIDKYFLLTMPDRVLPILEQHKELFKQSDTKNLCNKLEQRKNSFLEKYENSNWQSKRYSDYKAWKYLK